MLPNANSQGSSMVNRLWIKSPKIAHARYRTGHQPFKEIIHALAAQCNFMTYHLSLARFKRCNRSARNARKRALSRDSRKIFDYLLVAPFIASEPPRAH